MKLSSLEMLSVRQESGTERDRESQVKLSVENNPGNEWLVFDFVYKFIHSLQQTRSSQGRGGHWSNKIQMSFYRCQPLSIGENVDSLTIKKQSKFVANLPKGEIISRSWKR